MKYFASFSLSVLLLTVFSAYSAQINWKTTVLPAKNSLRGSGVYGDSLWVTGSNNGVFRSLDGGDSWQDVSVKASLVTDFRDIELFDQNTAIVMGVGTGELSVLYKTVDGGQSWQMLYANPDPKGFFDSIDFWDKKRGLMLGDPIDGHFVISKTLDGGNTWRRIAQDKMPAKRANEAAFAVSGNTLITGAGGKAWFTTGGQQAAVYSSVDYGENWSKSVVPIYANSDTAGGYSLALNTKDQLFVVGGDFIHRGKAYVNMATKIGSKWVIPNNSNKGLRSAMACIGKWCVATGKLFTWVSKDHGANWQMAADHGFYTMAAGNKVFVAAGHDGRVGVVKLSQLD